MPETEKGNNREPREALFAQALGKVKETAREQGNRIGGEQVREAFAPLFLEEEQFQLVLDYLRENKIRIDQPEDSDEYLSQEERDYLKNYLEELEALPQYRGGEIEAAAISAMAGEAGAVQLLTQMYLREVADVARLYAGQGVPLEDLIGEGNVALAAAAGMAGSLEGPEEVAGMLMRMVMNAMEELIRQNADHEKTGRKVARAVNRVADQARELAEEFHRKVTPEELAAETGISVKAIRDAMRMSGFKIEDVEDAANGL